MKIEKRKKLYVAYDDDGYVIIMSHNKKCVFSYLRQLGYVI